MDQRTLFHWIIYFIVFLGVFCFGYGIAPYIIHPERVWLTDSAIPDKKLRQIDILQARRSPPPPPSMERMKREGCIVDGLLSSYGQEKANIEMVKRLSCYSLHRALETWLEPPDFKRAMDIMKKVDKPVAVWGMFLAEAIDVKAEYYFPDEDRLFDFSGMCRPDTRNRWGEHTCVPFTNRKEYRLYIQYVTRRAMDLGIQNFLFGQVWLQDDKGENHMSEIIDQMRKDAEERGMEIVVGAQTNDIDEATYLQMFDYIEGGVGVNMEGAVEEGPCFSRWWKKEGDWCWALLWHDRFQKRAKNVWVHLDWSGRIGDDMSIFSRMNKEKRSRTLRELHKRFTEKGIGFLLPVMTALPKRNGGCFGERERYYSASSAFGCGDETVIKDILDGAWR